MLNEKQVNKLALDVFVFALKEISTWGDQAFYEVRATENGQLVPVYAGSSSEGYGSFLCEYSPLEALKKIVIECERCLDEFSFVVTDVETGESRTERLPIKNRQGMIKVMAESAGLYFLGYLGTRLGAAIEDAVLDSRIIAQSVVAITTATILKKTGDGCHSGRANAN